MKFFLSWSGQVSHQVAMALERWLPCVIQSIEPFISSGISKGVRWSDALEDELKESQYGIICVTPYNIHSAWMNFEAGALSKTLKESCVMPFLFGVELEDIASGPLSQFQSTIFEKSDVLSMMQSINKQIGKPLPNDLLDRTFEKWWGQLETDLKNIRPSGNETQAYYEWLYAQTDLDIYKSNAPYKSVWIITSDVGRYLGQEIKDKVVAACLEGKKVRYFLPYIEDYEIDLKMLAKSCGDKVEFKLFPADEFESQVASDYFIFNPDADGDLRVLVRLPLGNHLQQDFWFRTNDSAARNFVTRFRKLWDEKAMTATQSR